MEKPSGSAVDLGRSPGPPTLTATSYRPGRATCLDISLLSAPGSLASRLVISSLSKATASASLIRIDIRRWRHRMRMGVNYPLAMRKFGIAGQPFSKALHGCCAVMRRFYSIPSRIGIKHHGWQSLFGIFAIMNRTRLPRLGWLSRLAFLELDRLLSDSHRQHSRAVWKTPPPRK